MKEYYKVVCKCGHVGKKHYIPVTFCVYAENGKEAAKIARNIPRVKHNHKDAIISCSRISFNEALKINEANSLDVYLKCSSIQEQRAYCHLDDRLMDDNIIENVDNPNHIFRTNYKRMKDKEDIRMFMFEKQEYLESVGY